MAEEIDEVMMPVSTPEAFRHAEIHAMRQLGDAVTAQTKFFGEAMGANTRALERLVDKVDDVDRRLIRVEEAKHGRDIERVAASLVTLADRVNGLESTRDQAKGVGSSVGWVTRNAPWLITLLIAGALVAIDRLPAAG